MRIYTLAENTSKSEQFGSVHGLSFYINANGQNILFDMGPDGLFWENAKKLGVHPEDADLAVLSHGHNDHGGGLPIFLKENHTAKVYIRREAFEKHYSGAGNHYRDISIPKDMDTERFVFTDTVQTIAEGLTVFSNVTGKTLIPDSNRVLMKAWGDSMCRDDFTHEQSLIIEENGKLILIAGCAHRGIVNIQECAEQITGRPMDAVISGFHLCIPRTGEPVAESFICEIAAWMKEKKAMYYTCHCTGLEAYKVLRRELGDKVEYLSSGSVLEL